MSTPTHKPFQNIVNLLFDKAFDIPRAPRSTQYKAGVRAAIDSRINGTQVTCPYDAGTADSDAFYAGTDEGHAIGWAWRDAIKNAAGDTDTALHQLGAAS